MPSTVYPSPPAPRSENAPLPWWREPTRAQWLAFAAAWAGWVLDGFDFTVFLLTMRDIAKEFGVTYVATAGALTLTLLLRLAGGVAAGSLADRVGRKLPLMISIVWYAACDGAVAFAPSFGWVLLFRTLFGFGMGAEWTAGATLAMESWPARSRGLASGVLQGSWGVGYIAAALVHAAVVPAHGWRALFLIAALPALLVIPIRIFVPESRDWREAAARRPKVSFADLVREKVIARIVWASAFLGASFGFYYALQGLWPVLLQGPLHRSPAEVAALVVWFNVGYIIGAPACGAIASRWGVVPAIAVPLLILLGSLPLYVGAVPGLLWLGAFAAGALGGGVSGVTPLLFSVLFPAHVRGRAVGFVYHVGAGLGAIAPPVVAALWERGWMPLSRSIGLVAAALVVLALAIFLLRPRGLVPEGALAAHALDADGT